jgi:hypothetical protein
MRPKHLAATLAATVALSTGIGFGMSQASQPDPATAKPGGSTEIVKQLKHLNRSVSHIDDAISSQVVFSLAEINAAVYELCTSNPDTLALNCSNFTN